MNRKRWKMCRSKHRYPDKRAAVSAMARCLRLRGRHGRAGALRAYPCPICRGWHLTHLVKEVARG
jgi:hypothetical protein